MLHPPILPDVLQEEVMNSPVPLILMGTGILMVIISIIAFIVF